MNRWIAAAPRRVYASGGLRFYGAENAAARSEAPRPERGPSTADPFGLDLTADPKMAGLYLDPEQHDGYVHDRNVFEGGITIEDDLALIVDYDSGATLSYSLNAHSPWEGYRVAINGTRGRAELDVTERGAAVPAADGAVVLDPSATPGADLGTQLRPAGERLLLQRVFGHVSEDPLGRPAGYGDGVRAVPVGIAGNRSLATGSPVLVADLDRG